MKNTNCTDREETYYSIVRHGLFQKGCQKGTRETGNLLYIDQHIFKEKKRDKKMEIWRGLTTKSSTIRSRKDTRRSHKLYGNHEKLVSEIDSRRESFTWGENPGRCIVAINICNSDDTIQLHTQKFTGGYKFTKSQEKVNYQMYIDDIKLFAKKCKRIGDSNPTNKTLKSGWNRKNVLY